jgi:hypothetical protein
MEFHRNGQVDPSANRRFADLLATAGEVIE